ncbi:2fe-2s iron-sulfur cluster binding domain protein [Nannochloropsis gaditana]|uniref:2fe-2s iron-sulfur cluster binding domain protein n=1 Tax=Nannochloropsis gaditana TaxID=72520 RepID=W7TRL6_9STRA|nr:2fe-2s iron-sulfur cluster binding domain protein [Nannochloropsis gaditana]
MASALLAKKALRQALAVGAHSQATVGRRSGAVINSTGSSRRTLASVKDVTVNVTFINHEGLRITVPGRVGQSLLDVAQMHDIELESGCGGGGAVQQKKHSERWTEDLFGRGPCCHFCHVKIPSPWINTIHDKQPATEKEHELLEEHWQEEATDNSRLGCQVMLTKNLDGMQVFIPDGPPADCP